jgi:hypothetical protein
MSLLVMVVENTPTSLQPKPNAITKKQSMLKALVAVEIGGP